MTTVSHHSPPLWRSARDFADLLNPSHWRASAPMVDLPRGDGHAVLFLPGLGCPDLIMAPLHRFYAALGYATYGWELGFNFGPTPGIMPALRRRLFLLNDKSGARVSLVGKSMGGFLAKELARAHPDRVRRLALICAPIQHPVANRLAPILYALRPLFDSAIPRDLAVLSQPAPVPTTALHTKNDGLIAWQCCVEASGPNVENVEIEGAYHTTAATHPAALKIVAERLALPDR
jgi:pimeloyl-ACP methyl ester carboxylesterase